MDITVAASTAFGGLIGLPSSGGSSAGVIAARKESKIPGRLRASPEPKLIPTNLPAPRGVRFQRGADHWRRSASGGTPRPDGQPLRRCRYALESAKYLLDSPTNIKMMAARTTTAVIQPGPRL